MFNNKPLDKNNRNLGKQLSVYGAYLSLFSASILTSQLHAQQPTVDSQPPVLREFVFTPDGILQTQTPQALTVEVAFEEEGNITTAPLFLENLNTGEQLPLSQVTDWELTNGLQKARFTTTVDSDDTGGTWFVSGLVATDSENNQSLTYSNLTGLIVNRINPFISVKHNINEFGYDASLVASPAVTESGTSQISSFDIRLADAETYEVYVVPDDGTSIASIEFTNAISLAQSCEAFTDYVKCTVTALNNDLSFVANVATSSVFANLYGYSVLVHPSNSIYEANWLNNYIEFPIVDTDADGIPNEQDTDDDNDNVLDRDDLFPLDPTESTDFDSDGIGDFADTDDDNDGVDDAQDAFPFDPEESGDNDNDGLGNNSDLDDDNDGVLDSQDAFPFDPAESRDFDGDGIGDNADNDDDNDGGTDDNDAFPYDPSETIDSDGDGIGNNADTDDDNDGTPDTNDAFPRDPEENTDTDQDGIGNQADDDDDNDGILDEDDLFPLDPGDFLDNDQDGIGNNADPDDDNDGVVDEDDAFPFNPLETRDTDLDGIGNNADPDDDNDGLDDEFDRFPLNADEIADFDNDSIGNNADPDDDNDGVLDVVDAFPFAVTEWFDTDNDGIGNNADPDNDNDGVVDEFDAFENDPLETLDTDGDTIGNNADLDDDNDGTTDLDDAFPLDPLEDTDTDSDGMGNNTDTDDDNDRVIDELDLFPLNPREYADNDLDGFGNNQDPDDDNDMVLDLDDAFPFDPTESADNDFDGIGDNSDPDDDNDTVTDEIDLFPFDPTEWADNDLDGIGDNRDSDDDDDGTLDEQDAFPFDPSETQDFDKDGIGNNADDDDDNDGVFDDVDAFPFTPSESEDTDQDGIGNNADNDDDNDGIVDEEDIAPLNATIGDDQAPQIEGLIDITVEATAPLTEVVLTDPIVRDNNLNPASLSNSYNAPLPLGTNQITWTAIDFAGNQTQAIQIVEVVDTLSPQFDFSGILDISARGIFTDVSNDLEIFATDIVDGEIAASIITESKLKSGHQSVLVQATDSSGNTSVSEIQLNILPKLTGKDSGFASPGRRVDIPIALSGKPAIYPVTIDYSVAGPVIDSLNGTLSIEEGQTTTLSLTLSPTSSAGQQVVVAFGNPENAIIDEFSQVVLDITNENFAPSASLSMVQQNTPVTIAYQNLGLATIHVNMNDINVDDRHSVIWQVTKTGNVPGESVIKDKMLDDSGNTFEFDPLTVTPGNYIAQAKISEIGTIEQHTITLEYPFTIALDAPNFANNLDSDLDGLADNLEGVNDLDSDGIPDYLDDESNSSMLPTGASRQAITTSAGLILQVGDIARMSSNGSATNARVSQLDIANFGSTEGSSTSLANDIHYEHIQEIQNFNVTNLEFAGQSVPVVIPLNTGTVIPENAVYRKFSPSQGWTTFVENAHNLIKSAPFDADGNCPNHTSTVYANGLNPSDQCILLVIQDGGPNDSDGLVNSQVKDPGVLAVQQPNTSPSINVARQTTVIEGDEVRVDASMTRDLQNDSLVYKWEQLSGLPIEISENTTPLLSFIAPQVSQNETLTFKLEVFDGRDTSSTTVTVSIRNANNVPDILINQHASQIIANEQIVINATAVDKDGDTLTYLWRQTQGPAVQLQNASSLSVSFTAPSVSSSQAIGLTLSVFDGQKEVTTSTTITVLASNSENSGSGDSSDGGGGSLSCLYLLSLLILCFSRRETKLSQRFSGIKLLSE